MTKPACPVVAKQVIQDPATLPANNLVCLAEIVTDTARYSTARMAAGTVTVPARLEPHKPNWKREYPTSSLQVVCKMPEMYSTAR